MNGKEKAATSNWFTKFFDNDPEILTLESVIQGLNNARGFLIMDNCTYKIMYLSAIGNAIKYLEAQQNEE